MKHHEVIMKRLTLLAAALFFAGFLLFNYVGCSESTEEADKEAPAEVRSVTGTAGDTQITLNWRDPPDEDFNKVQITYTPGGNTAVEIEKGVQTAVVSGLANGTAYTFTLKTADTSGNVSAGVRSAAYTPAEANPDDTTPPAEVSGVNGIAGDAQITLNWRDPTDEDFERVEIIRSPGNSTVRVEKGVLTAVINNLTNGTSYTFNLKTVDASGNTSAGVRSAAYTPAAPNPADTTPPAEVSGVTGTPGNRQITLTWTDPSDEDFNKIQITRTPGNATVEVGRGAQTAVINNLTNGTSYTFNLKTVDASGNASAGVSSAAYTPADTTPPAEVSGVNGIAGNSQITLTWTDPSDEDFERVEIIRSPGNSTVRVEKGVQTAVINNLTNGTSYTFNLKTIDASGNASAGVNSSAYTPAAPNPADTTPPAEVSGVNGTLGNRQITLTWTDPSDNDFNKVQITRTPDNAMVEVGRGVQTAVINNLTNGTSYTFNLKTVDASGNASAGVNSAAYTPAAPNPADTTPPAEVSRVNGVQGGVPGNGQVRLTWTDPTDNDFTKVAITYTPGGNTAVEIGKGVQTAVVSGLTNGTAYTFTLKTVDASGNASTGVTGGTYTPAPSSTAPTVYMTADISSEGLMAVYNALGRTPAAGQNVAIKVTTGEPPNSNYLKQELIGAFRQSVNGTYVECMTAYGGQRASIALAKTVAANHGFTPFDLMDEEGAVQIPTPSASTYLTYDIVGSHINNYNFMVVLSHFKGHAMGGFGGAIKNMSIGIGTREGKCWIHSHGTSTTSPWFSDDRFRQSMAEAAGAVANKFGNNIIYINVLNRLSVDCDCNGNPAAPDMHDIGILASLDPVAIDKASYDLVKAAPDNNRLGQRMDQLNGILQATHGAAIGIGSLVYNLMWLD